MTFYQHGGAGGRVLHELLGRDPEPWPTTHLEFGAHLLRYARGARCPIFARSRRRLQKEADGRLIRAHSTPIHEGAQETSVFHSQNYAVLRGAAFVGGLVFLSAASLKRNQRQI